MEKKVLFVGQETHSWGQMNSDPKLSVEDLQIMYRNFNLGKSAFYEKPKYLTSPFWNFSRSFFHNLNKQNKDVIRKTNGFLWTNISKFDINGTTPEYKFQKRNTAGFELLKTEIFILKPDVVVFMTGTKYNELIEQLFKPEREIIIENNFLTKLHDKNNLLPPLTFQTMHPGTLQRSKNSVGKSRYHEVLCKMTEMVLYNKLCSFATCAVGTIRG